MEQTERKFASLSKVRFNILCMFINLLSTLMQVLSLYDRMALAMTPRSLLLNELAMVYGTTPPGHLEL